jgi:hypothetical protein
VEVKGKKPSKKRGKRRENAAMAHPDASILTGKMPVSLRKKHV